MMICVKFDWNWPSGSREEDFLNSSMYFCNFVILTPWKRAEPFIWTNLNPLYPRMLCAKFGWNWPSGAGEDDFSNLLMYFRNLVNNFVNVFLQFRNSHPLEKGRALYLNKFESPSPKDALCQVWLKLAKWFWRRRCLRLRWAKNCHKVTVEMNESIKTTPAAR